jgi:iron complex outermembrane recepter protein
MSSRRKPINLAAVLSYQLCVAGLVAAQTPPAETTPPVAPPPSEASTVAPAEAAPAEAVTPGRRAAQEEIIVTGSRIRRKDLTTPAPITVVNRDQITASGRVSIGDFLQTLPEQGNAINTSVNNGGDGATRISLRGLGDARTLVLVNGRRFVPGGIGADASVDLNSIPSSAIERVEVLKDGASAIYGSDAIGGVVNLITRKRFNGAEVSGFSGTTNHGDGTIWDFNGTAGVSGERGSALFNIGYYQQKAVWAGDRFYSKVPRAFDATGDNNAQGIIGEYHPGSGTIPAGRFIRPTCTAARPTGCFSRTAGIVQEPNPNNDPRITLFNTLLTQNPRATSFIRDPSTTLGWRPFRGAVLPEEGGDGYNFQPQNYLVTPQTRYSMFSTGETRLGWARGYYEGSFVNRQSQQKLAPEPLLTDLEGVVISKNNQYNPFGVDIPGFRRRLLEFGNRTFTQDLDTIRMVVGIDATLPDAAGPLKGWFVDASLNYGRVTGTQVKQGNLFVPNLQGALGPSAPGNPAGGRCVDVSGNNIPCLNLFGGGVPPSITPDQIENLTFTGTLKAINQMTSAQFNTSGELFKLLHDRPVGLAAGYEYRILSGALIPDPVTVLGLTTGNKGLITQGRYYVHELYGELSIPIVSGMPFAESLEGTAALRWFDYNNFGSDVTYKFGLLYRIIPDFTVRGTYSTAFRAPNIADLFFGQSDSFPPVRDPCRGTAAGGPTPPPNCGVAANNNDDQTQLRSRVGGNEKLQPETAKIFTAGVVVEPQVAKGLSLTADYYHIQIDQSITTIGAATILNLCYPAGGGTPQYCEKITRDPVTQRILTILDTQQNVGQDKTDGIDLSVRYVLPTEFGRFGFVWNGTWLHKYNRRLASGQIIRGRGTFDLAAQGVGGTYPAWKFISGVTYGIGGLGAGVTMHYIGAFHECGDDNGDFSGTGQCYAATVNPIFSRKVSDWASFDLVVSYSFFTQFGKTTVALGANNVFDKTPAVIYNGFLAASDAYGGYDFLGRFGYARLTQSF